MGVVRIENFKMGDMFTKSLNKALFNKHRENNEKEHREQEISECFVSERRVGTLDTGHGQWSGKWRISGLTATGGDREKKTLRERVRDPARPGKA